MEACGNSSPIVGEQEHKKHKRHKKEAVFLVPLVLLVFLFLFFVKFSTHPHVYTNVKQTLTTGFISMSMEDPVLEIDDFERLVEQYRPRVLRFVFASVRDWDLAETLTQDCFWKAYRHRSTFRRECSALTWLMRIAVNLVRDHTRTRRFQFWRKAESVDHNEIHDWADRSISPEEKTAVNEKVQAVWEATKTLSERQRTVFLLRFVEDLNIPEIAETTGLTENAVNVHLYRAVRGIRKRLRQLK